MNNELINKLFGKKAEKCWYYHKNKSGKTLIKTIDCDDGVFKTFWQYTIDGTETEFGNIDVSTMEIGDDFRVAFTLTNPEHMSIYFQEFFQVPSRWMFYKT